MNRIDRNRGANISFKDALRAPRQVKIVPESFERDFVGAMNCKRRYEDGKYLNQKRKRNEYINARSKCMGCGENGDWFRGHPKCVRVVDGKKKRERENREQANDSYN